GRSGLVALARLVEGVTQRDGDEALALGDLRLQFLRLRADLRPLDVVLGQVAVQLRVACVAVVAPAGGEEEVHDVQAEAEVPRSRLLVEEAPLRDPADVALLADACLKRVGVDLHVLVGLLDRDLALRLRGRRGPARKQSGDEGEQQGGLKRAHETPPWGNDGCVSAYREWGRLPSNFTVRSSLADGLLELPQLLRDLRILRFEDGRFLLRLERLLYAAQPEERVGERVQHLRVLAFRQRRRLLEVRQPPFSLPFQPHPAAHVISHRILRTLLN